MRQRDESGHAGADIDHRLLDLAELVLCRTVEFRDECRRHAVRTGLDWNARRGQIDLCFRSIRIDLEEGRTRAVDRNLDLLSLQVVGKALPVQRLEKVVVKGDLERVVAVGRKVVHERRAAARAERRALDVSHLVHDFRHGVHRHGRLDLRVANGETADLARGANVSLNQRRRDGESVRQVVKSARGLVRRQERRYVDVGCEQIANRIAVLGAVDAMKLRRAGERVECGGTIDRRFERRNQRVRARLFRSWRAGRRHQPRRQLSNHPLGGLGVAGGIGQIDCRPGKAAGLAAIVVTSSAVLVDYRLVRRYRAPLDRLGAP